MGGVALSNGDQKAASQKKLNGLHHSLPAEANGGGNIVGAAHTAGQKGLNDLECGCHISSLQGQAGSQHCCFFAQGVTHPRRHREPAFEIRLLCYTVP